MSSGPGEQPTESKRIVAGVCAILLGALGVHKFILGMTVPGVIMLVVGLVGIFLCGIPTVIVWVVAVIEGIIYLTKSDAEFHQIYEVDKKQWF